MTILEGVLLGAVQGLTEFIPISSSGHLILAQHIFGIQVSVEFDSLINLGTLLALVIYFRRKLWQMCIDIFRDKNMRLATNILIAAIPVGSLGFMFSDELNSTLIQNPFVVVITLTIFGLLMIFVDKLPRLTKVSSMQSLSKGRSLLIGLAQVAALIPGTSRSASTMLAGRAVGLAYKDAAEFSFLLSIPVMLGVVLHGFMSKDGLSFVMSNPISFMVSNVVAFATGLFAVGFMIKFLSNGNLKPFGYYRLAMAGIIAILVL